MSAHSCGRECGFIVGAVDGSRFFWGIDTSKADIRATTFGFDEEPEGGA